MAARRAPIVLFRAVVAVLLIASTAVGQTVLEDPAGDVELAIYSQSTSPPGDWSPIDLRFLTVEETADELLFTVGVEALATCDGGQCYNAGDLRNYFSFGGQHYYVQQGMSATGQAYGQLHSNNDGQVNGPLIAGGLGATFDREANTVTANVPRELVLDSSGGPPAKGRVLDNFVTRSYSQYSLGGPEVDGTDDMFVLRDRMGFEAPGMLEIQFGGRDQSGPVSVYSPAPYRASNGGATTYRYDLSVAYHGDENARFNITTANLPSTWQFERPAGDLPLTPGENRTFSVLVHTPSGHAHGGADVFQLRVEQLGNPDTWASVDLGVHYLTVPQPAGHHPTLFLHSLTDSVVTDVLAVFGGDTGRIWMNTLNDDPGDTKASIVGREGPQGFIEQATHWSICLIPNLRLGLDFDIEKTGSATITLAATAPHQGVSLTGRLLHLDGPEDLDFCEPSIYGNQQQTVLATLGGAAQADLLNGASEFDLTVTPTPASDVVPYTQGAQLVLELTATYTGGDPTHGGLALAPGGSLTLPLLEYRDDRPAGFVDGSVADAPQDELDLGSFEESGPRAESPAAFPLLLLLGVALWLRRR